MFLLDPGDEQMLMILMHIMMAGDDPSGDRLVGIYG
jgi:hypothetical protein